MKQVSFHPVAEIEMIEAAKYYETTQKILGKRFLASVQTGLINIQINPLFYPVIEFNVRRYLTKIFPYGLLYIIQANQIIIIAVMNLNRKPNYWKSRLGNS